tara:strand:- start:19 stop:459 length:441 start_codon:yes stop_codon:yes gene_type:complete
MKKTLIISLIGLILMSGCEKKNYQNPPTPNIFLDLHSDQLDYNGEVYIFNYPDDATNSYFKVDYHSPPLQRIYWSSPDMFYVIMFNDTIWTSVVNFSTYSNDDGTGHQMVYVNPTLIGDTLNIIGKINEIGYEIYKEILVKIESYE